MWSWANQRGVFFLIQSPFAALLRSKYLQTSFGWISPSTSVQLLGGLHIVQSEHFRCQVPRP